MANLAQTISTLAQSPNRRNSTVNSAVRLINIDGCNLAFSPRTERGRVVLAGRKTTVVNHGDSSQRMSMNKFTITIMPGYSAEPAIEFSATCPLTDAEKETVRSRLCSSVIERDGSYSIDRTSTDEPTLREALRTSGLYCMTTRPNEVNAAYIQCIARAFMSGVKMQWSNALDQNWQDLDRLPLNYIGVVFREKPVSPSPAPRT